MGKFIQALQDLEAMKAERDAWKRCSEDLVNQRDEWQGEAIAYKADRDAATKRAEAAARALEDGEQHRKNLGLAVVLAKERIAKLEAERDDWKARADAAEKERESMRLGRNNAIEEMTRAIAERDAAREALRAEVLPTLEGLNGKHTFIGDKTKDPGARYFKEKRKWFLNLEEKVRRALEGA